MELNECELNNFYDNHYFKINKKLLIYSGLWPYEISRFYQLAPQIALYLILLVAQYPLFNGCRKWCGTDIDYCGENVAGIIYSFTIVSKLSVTYLSKNELKLIYQRLAKNWLEIIDPEEHEILVEYARQGRKKSIGYLVFMALAGISFCQLPTLPRVLDIIFPLNESRPDIPFVNGVYPFDRVEHFYKLYVFYLIATITSVITMTSIDTTFTVIVHQILGILEVVKYRLYLATVSFDTFKDISYEIIIKAIRLHKEALQFIDLIQESYKFFFLTVIGNTTIFVAIGVILITSDNSLLDLFRFMTTLFACTLHFLFLTWPGQKIMDYSNDVFTSTYTNEWYNISEKSKTLLKIIMLRSVKPCILSAVGLYTMNLENFGIMMKSALSYVTVINSFR